MRGPLSKARFLSLTLYLLPPLCPSLGATCHPPTPTTCLPFSVEDAIYLPFIQEIRGAGQAAGRQSRVAASPSSSTWSLSLMWKTGGKSEGKETAQDPGCSLPREGQMHVSPGAAGLAGNRANGSLLPAKCGEQKLIPGLREFSCGKHHLLQALRTCAATFLTDD